MIRLLEKIYDMLKRLFAAKAATSRRNESVGLPYSPIVHAAEIDMEKARKNKVKTLTVTVPQPKNTPISLDKESTLINRLYDELYEFALYYTGRFEVNTYDSDNPTYIIPKNENRLCISRGESWNYHTQSKEMKYAMSLYNKAEGNAGTALTGFPVEQLKQLYDLYQDKLARQQHDESQLKTINHIKRFIEE